MSYLIPMTAYGQIGPTASRVGAGRYNPTGLDIGPNSYTYTPYGSTAAAPGTPASYDAYARSREQQYSGATTPHVVSGSGDYAYNPDLNRYFAPGSTGSGLPASGSGQAGQAGQTGQPRTSTTTESSTMTAVRDPRSEALMSLLEDIIAGRREAVDRDRAFAASMDVATGARAQQAGALRDQLAATGGSLTDPSVRAQMRALESQRQVEAARAGRDISMQADQAKLAAQFAAADRMQTYDPLRQTGSRTSTTTTYDPYADAAMEQMNRQYPPYDPYAQLNTRGTDWRYSYPPSVRV